MLDQMIVLKMCLQKSKGYVDSSAGMQYVVIKHAINFDKLNKWRMGV